MTVPRSCLSSSGTVTGMRASTVAAVPSRARWQAGTGPGRSGRARPGRDGEGDRDLAQGCPADGSAVLAGCVGHSYLQPSRQAGL
jgi:hypothetical protein